MPAMTRVVPLRPNRMRGRVLCASAAVVSCLCLGLGSAQAQPAEKDDEGSYTPEYERRSDVAAGVSLSIAAASASGYPNEAGKLDNPAFVADPGVGVGSYYAVWIGGALRDWFTFGLGLAGFGYEANGLQATGSGFIVRVETFPMFYAFEEGRDIGVYGTFGLGPAKIKDDDRDRADGGAVSIVGFGVFYEPLRFGSFSAGPTVEYTRIFSQSMDMQSASAGFRLAVYAGP